MTGAFFWGSGSCVNGLDGEVFSSESMEEGGYWVRRVIVESDSTLAIVAINNYSWDLFEFGLLVEDVRQVAELLVEDGLSTLIAKKGQCGALSGIHICEGALNVHHLLFADDSFLFRKASLDDANVGSIEQISMVWFLGVQVVEQHERYLGLSTFVGKNKKKKTFSYIKEWVMNKICGWKGKCLSSAGRELLIKVVAQALPAFAMYCFLLPRTFCDDLHKLMARFWWGSDPNDDMRVQELIDTESCLRKLVELHALFLEEEWLSGG
ncbi:uncharacterized protein LOC125470283 [Pyrus x bretschneideri]|uniref:uncharacterized protein LOC125470283 n=1 Tax=Pyrus x bretschneideri TaxID=225117 RepID=UPI00202FDFC8|nr:uncharacterized protein LOC125470283 [Pyrus x bretschneideri]